MINPRAAVVGGAVHQLSLYSEKRLTREPLIPSGGKGTSGPPIIEHACGIAPVHGATCHLLRIIEDESEPATIRRRIKERQLSARNRNFVDGQFLVLVAGDFNFPTRHGSDSGHRLRLTSILARAIGTPDLNQLIAFGRNMGHKRIIGVVKTPLRRPRIIHLPPYAGHLITEAERKLENIAAGSYIGAVSDDFYGRWVLCASGYLEQSNLTG
jgi:hypothetical protein